MLQDSRAASPYGAAPGAPPPGHAPGAAPAGRAVSTGHVTGGGAGRAARGDLDGDSAAVALGCVDGGAG